MAGYNYFSNDSVQFIRKIDIYLCVCITNVCNIWLHNVNLAQVLKLKKLANSNQMTCMSYKQDCIFGKS